MKRSSVFSFCLFPFPFLLIYVFYIQFVKYYTKSQPKGREKSQKNLRETAFLISATETADAVLSVVEWGTKKDNNH